MNLDLNQFKDLDLDNIGDWPGVVKGFFTILVFAAVIGGVLSANILTLVVLPALYRTFGRK